jgi:hypothetical protein
MKRFCWFIVLLLVTCSGCQRSAPPASSVPRFPERTFTDHWSMDPVALKHFTENANAVPVGADIREVIRALGAPDVDHAVQKNEYHRTFTYYVTRKLSDHPLESDKYVLFGFDRDGRLERVYSDVESIPSKNWPWP